MKALLLATAMVAAPSLAQTAPTPQTPPATDPATALNTTEANAQPAPTPPPPPGTQVVFQQPPSVDQAFPPPPAKESYPWCSKTVTDSCKQRFNPK